MISDHIMSLMNSLREKDLLLALKPGDSTSALTERMKMDDLSNAEYAGIDDINITITSYAMGTEGMSTNPTEAWEQCRIIGNIQ